MWRFSIFRFQVQVHWLFGLTAAFIAGGLHVRSPEQWLRVFIQMAIIFVSILAHELGHAFMARRLGGYPHIVLYGLGGLTYLGRTGFTRKEAILISAAGPAAGFALAGLFHLGLILSGGVSSPYLPFFLSFGGFINVAWTCLNLLPILPMDGGQILKEALGPSRLRTTCWVGILAAAGCCFYAFWNGWPFLGILMVFFCYQNYKGQSHLR